MIKKILRLFQIKEEQLKIEREILQILKNYSVKRKKKTFK
jgi:hypothetical protein